MRVLFDGWPLVYQPNSLPAIHLLALLAYCPPEVEALVALPGQPPDWLPGSITPLVEATTDHPGSHLTWEQRLLTRIARRNAADLLHLTAPNAPLWGGVRAVVSPAAGGEEYHPGRSAAERLREALSRGGMGRAHALFWPEDISPPSLSLPLQWLPPFVHPAFMPNQVAGQDVDEALQLPETYILYHGPAAPADLQRLLEAWSWAAPSIGDYYPLVMVGLGEQEQRWLVAQAGDYNLGENIRILPGVVPQDLPAVYQKATALFHPAPIHPWGNPLRLGLASGKPVVAADTPWTDDLVGPAAYLAPAQDARALGAALITVIVEESLAGDLSQAGRERSARWRPAELPARLLEAYRAVTDVG